MNLEMATMRALYKLQLTLSLFYFLGKVVLTSYFYIDVWCYMKKTKNKKQMHSVRNLKIRDLNLKFNYKLI